MNVPMPGVVVGDGYRLERVIGRGGMGQVWLATQLTTQKPRALKLLDPAYAFDAEACRRFLDEARAPSRIESEHVVGILGSGMDRQMGIPWLAMELLEGEHLAEAIKRRGTYAPHELLPIAEELGHALGAAHAAGVIHRDLKLENVFLAKTKRADGATTVKLLDFGIATLLSDEKTRATVTSAVGTPLWWAPEQMQAGDHVSTATDVWALGLLVFYALSGRSYWKSAYDPNPSVATLVDELFTAPLPRASDRARDQGFTGALPEGFDDWMASCVARDPRTRFKDARLATDALLPILRRAGNGSGSGITAMPFRSSLPPGSGSIVLPPAAAEPATIPSPLSSAAPAPMPAPAPSTTAPVFAAPDPDAVVPPPAPRTAWWLVALGVLALVPVTAGALVLGWMISQPPPAAEVRVTVVEPPRASASEAAHEVALADVDASVAEPTEAPPVAAHHRTTTEDDVEPDEAVHAEPTAPPEPEPEAGLAAALAAPGLASSDAAPEGRHVAFGDASATRRAGSPSAGMAFDDACPAGAALVGLRGTTAGAIGRVAGVCARLTIPDAEGAVGVGPAFDLPLHGGGTGTTSRLVCDHDEVLVGFRGRASAVLERLSLYCAPLSVDAAGAITLGPEHGSSASLGGSGGDPFETVLCGEGRVGRVVHVRASEAADALGLGCAVPTVR